MQSPWSQRVALLGLVVLTGALIGCAERSPSLAQPSDSTLATAPSLDWEMQWAQAALERNPNLEVMNADREQRAFTVRDRNTALTTDVQLAQLAAAPIEFLTVPGSTAPSSEPAEATPKPAIAAPTEPEVPSRLAAVSDAAQSVAAPSTKSPSYTIDRSSGRTRVIGEGISVVYGEAPNAASDGPVNEAPNLSGREPPRGPARFTAPGVSIERSDAPASAAQSNSAQPGTEVEPVICEGPRVMQLDSRTINVEGDALTARAGCELYITNSTIIASGTAVVIGDATVHINNSRIAGGLASFDAKARAKVFLRGSTLNGLPRLNSQALIQDQGGNRYQ